MDNRYYDNVIAEMQSFFDENNFKVSEDGSFVADTKAVKVLYDEPRQMYVLKMAEVTDGTIGENTEVSSWLFDDSQNPKDAASVGIDFAGTVREKMGIKIKRAAAADNVDLPTATKSGTYTITGFTKKVLDVFPAYKDAYKAHIAVYGNFLYLSFFGENLVPQMKQIIFANDKKNMKKLCELLADGYVKGDKETVNTVVALICAAVYNDEGLKTNILEALKDEKHLYDSVKNYIPVFEKNKKLKSLLIKE
ncbi:MAG: hypothetical protein IKK24_02910 [Clostridia bacterium]|nr:hypothetical protein [Clostridia bacterium]